jgi:serine/threonine-protein kinase
MRSIGRYMLDEELGRGSMGTVFRASDPLIERSVAIKTVDLGKLDDGTLQPRLRFLREAKAAGRLSHPGIVTVHDVGELEDVAFIVMELVEGRSLKDVLDRGEKIPLAAALAIISQTADALDFAHKHGVVHRDVKPGNIRVGPAGEVKIMDFGLARLPSSTATKSGRLLGTVQYMAPEQVEGAHVDHRADIFSVGAIAYELVAHRKPFQGDSLTAVMVHIMQGAPDPTALPATAYSPGLERIILKALARDRSARYPSLDAMHADLLSLVRDAARLLLAPRKP